MDKKRKAYAPFSLTSEAGVAQTPVEGYIDVNQSITPVVNTGVVNENGKWEGVKASDTEFKIFGTDIAVVNGQAISSPVGAAAEENFIDMTGFKDIFIAFRVSNTGNYRIQAVMASNVYPFANLTPTNEATVLRGNTNAWNGSSLSEIGNLVLDSADTLTADVWSIFAIQDRLKDQRAFQINVTNNSGGDSDIQFAYMRLV